MPDKYSSYKTFREIVFILEKNSMFFFSFAIKVAVVQTGCERGGGGGGGEGD